jgi:hypothetical protein
LKIIFVKEILEDHPGNRIIFGVSLKIMRIIFRPTLVGQGKDNCPWGPLKLSLAFTQYTAIE